MADKKHIIKEAIAEYNQITEFAMKEAKEDMAKKVDSKLEKILDKQLKENISIEKDGVDVEVTDTTVTIEKGGTKVTVGDSEAEVESGFDMGAEMGSEIEPIMGGEIESGFEAIGDEEEIEGGDAEDEIETFDSEEAEAEEIDDETSDEDDEDEEEPEEIEETLFEIKEIVEDQELEDEGEPEMANPFDIILSRLDDIESKLEGGTSDEGDAEGEVEIVDDEEVAEPGEELGGEEEVMEDPLGEEPAGDETAMEPEAEEEAPAMEEEFSMNTFEESDFIAEDEQLEETIEIVDEDDFESVEGEEGMEEMHGVSHSVSTKGQSSKFGGENNPKSQSKRINKEHKEFSELTAQQDSNIEELNEENDSLKTEIEEYKNSFIELRTQFHEMNTLNAKLALANKILTNGGLTNSEKVAINEAFAEASNAEAAKKVYDKIIKEHSISIKKSGLDKVRSSSIKAGQPTEKSETETLYESDESRRWQNLAGIKPLNG